MTDIIGWIILAVVVLALLKFVFSGFGRTNTTERSMKEEKSSSLYSDYYEEREAKLDRILPLEDKNIELDNDIYPTKVEQFDGSLTVIRGRIKKVEQKIEYGRRMKENSYKGKMSNDKYLYNISFVDGKKILPLTSSDKELFLEGGINRIVINKDLSVRETTCE